MFRLDEDFLNDCGLGALSDDDKKSLLAEVSAALEVRVGTALSSACSDGQLEEFEALIDVEAPQTELQAWLQRNIPDYQQAVRAAVADLKQDIIRQSRQILRASNR